MEYFSILTAFAFYCFDRHQYQKKTWGENGLSHLKSYSPLQSEAKVGADREDKDKHCLLVCSEWLT